MSPRRSSGASHEGGQTGSGHENAEPVLLAPREFLVSGRLGRCFLRGLRCRFGRGLLAGLPFLLRREFLLDCRGDGVNVHLVDLRGIAENLRGVGLVVHGQENDRLHQDAAQLAFLGLGQKRRQQFRRGRRRPWVCRCRAAG